MSDTTTTTQIVNNPDGTTSVVTDEAVATVTNVTTPSDATQTTTPAATTVESNSATDSTAPVSQDQSTSDSTQTQATQVADPNVTAAPASTTNQSSSAVAAPASSTSTTTPMPAVSAQTTAPSVATSASSPTTTTPAINTPPVAVAVPVAVVATPVATPVPTTGTVNPTIAAALADPSITPGGAVILGEVNSYMNNMHPKKSMTSPDGAKHQAIFFKTLVRGINLLESDFNLVYGTILRVFHEEKDAVFAHTHVFRFMENVTLPKTDRILFQRLVNMFKVTADPKARALSIKQVDVNATMSSPSFTEKARQKILAFYNIL